MSKTPSTYTVSRLRVLYQVFLDKYDFLRLSPRAFFEWLDARGEKDVPRIEDNPLDKHV